MTREISTKTIYCAIEVSEKCGVSEKHFWCELLPQDDKERPQTPALKKRKILPTTYHHRPTKKILKKAASSILCDVAHEALVLSRDALQLAPIIGLGEAARVLLSIWDSIEAVDANHVLCLRLVERCETILRTIEFELDAAGPDVRETLCVPMKKLTDSFRRVEQVVRTQVSRPFIQRYLKRQEDACKVRECDASLTDSVGLFNMALQIRMFRRMHECPPERARS